ncbi:manganase accumulation protein MntS [Pluralibacter gergoviae]|nr:manganase accumulation protein MntS [Pluralibacter gergoviae]MDU4002889.1 manganase accumulation protein MntS [Pluralibacter gergoviae]
MNELQRYLAVFKHSPFKVRLMLIDMLCDLFSEKPQQEKNHR